MARSSSDEHTSLVTANRVGAAGLVILAIVFIAENTRHAKIRFIVPEVNAPIWLALLITAAVGVLAGVLLARQRSK